MSLMLPQFWKLAVCFEHFFTLTTRSFKTASVSSSVECSAFMGFTMASDGAVSLMMYCTRSIPSTKQAFQETTFRCSE